MTFSVEKVFAGAGAGRILPLQLQLALSSSERRSRAPQNWVLCSGMFYCLLFVKLSIISGSLKSQGWTEIVHTPRYIYSV